MKLIETILEEWAHRVPDGSPTQKNPYHLVILEDVLHEKKLPKEAISYILNKLREADAEVMGKTVAQAREKAKRGQTYSSEKAKKSPVAGVAVTKLLTSNVKLTVPPVPELLT